MEDVASSTASAVLPTEDRQPNHTRIIALLGGAQAVIVLAGLVRWKLIALFVGPSGVGVAGIIDRSAQIALQVGALHIPTAALRFLAIAREDRDRQRFDWLYRTLMRAVLSASGFVAAGWGVCYLLWPKSFGPGMAIYAGAVLWGLAAVPVTAATNLLRCALATLDRHRAAAATFLASSVLLAAGTYVGLKIAGLTGAYVAAFVVATVTAAALHQLVMRGREGERGAGAGSLAALIKSHPEIVRFSLTLYATGIAMQLGYGIAQWTVLRQLGLRESGFLAASYTVAYGLRGMFVQASTQYLIPFASRTSAKHERAAEVERYVRTLALLLLAGVLPLLLFPYELLVALYSRQFAAASGVLGFFILAEVVMVVADAYRVLLLGADDLRGYFTTAAIGAAIVVVGVGVVAPVYGLGGVALLHLGASVMVLAWSVARAHSRDGVRIDLGATALPVYALAALTVAMLVGRGIAEPSVVRVSLKAALGAAVAFGAWPLVPEAERRSILRAVRRSKGRAS